MPKTLFSYDKIQIFFYIYSVPAIPHINLYTLPEWKEAHFSTEDEDEAWKYAADLEAAKALYNKWREVFYLVMVFTDNLPEENEPHSIRNMIFENAMMVSPKLISAAGDMLYIVKMENASIIRTNCKQLMDQVIFSGLTEKAERHHEQVIRDSMEEFKNLFKDWVATFKKDDCEDDWGLY